MKMTCLHDRHVALGAKMSPFAGFDMPIQYSGIIDEHNAVRTAAGMFDVSHMGEVFISGKDATRFVNHIFTNDVSSMPDGKILYGMMLYPDGGTVDDLLVYKEFAPDEYLLVVNAANIEKDYEWMKSNCEGFDVKIVNASDSWGRMPRRPLPECSGLLRLLLWDSMSFLTSPFRVRGLSSAAQVTPERTDSRFMRPPL